MEVADSALKHGVTDSDYTTDELSMINKYADEAEAGYDVANLRRRGRPRLGPAAYSVVVPIRITPELASALDARGALLNQTRSETVRDILERSLAPI